MSYPSIKKIFSILKLVFGILIIIFLFSYIDAGKVFDIITSINLNYLFVIIIFWIVNQLLLTLRWQFLLRPLGYKIRFYPIFLTTLSGKFIDSIAPGGYGVDVMRYWDLSRFSGEKLKPVISIFIDRFFGLTGCIAIGMLAILPVSMYVNDNKIVYQLLGFYGLIVVIILIFLIVNLIPHFKKKTNFLYIKLNYVVEQFEKAIGFYKNYKKIIIKCFIISIILRILMIINIYLFSKAIGWDTSILYFFLFIPCILILTILPISTHSLGVQEGLFVYFFLQINIPAESSMALSLTLFSWKMVSSLMCGFVFLSGGKGYVE